ncbi:MAG: MATE family efflux transporter [Lachnospiraceae bacterium]
MKTEKQIVMTEGNAFRLLLTFALPLMLGNVFQQMYTVVDTMVVGKGMGVDALAALGASDWLNWMNIGIVTGLAQGFSIKMAQEFGAGATERLKKTIGNTLLLSILCSAVLLMAFQCLAAPVLRLLLTPEEILPMTLLYVRIIFAGIPITVIYNVLAATLRAIGDGTSPLYAMIVASCTNIVLDVLFVIVLRFGIAGAAAATLLAQLVAVWYCLKELKKTGLLSLNTTEFSMEPALWAKQLRLSLPLAVQNGIIAIGGMMVQSVVNGFGVIFIAGYTATNKLYGVLEIAATSYGYAISTYVGQNIGAGKKERITTGHRASLLLAVGTSLVISAVMLLLGRQIIGLFLSGTPEEVTMAGNIAFRFLTMMSLALPALYLLYVYRSALQGMGNTFIPMVSGMVEFTMRIGSALLLTKVVGEDGVFYAEILAWLGAAVLLGVSYYVIMIKERIKLI